MHDSFSLVIRATTREVERLVDKSKNFLVHEIVNSAMESRSVKFC